MQVFIDLDGTILDVQSRYHAVYRDILSAYGYDWLDTDIFWQCKRDRMPVYSILSKTGAEDKKEEFKKQWQNRIEQERYLELDEVWPGMKDFLSSCGAGLVLVTMRRDRDGLLSQIDRLFFSGCFKQVISVSPKVNMERHELKAMEIKRYLNDSCISNSEAVIAGDSEADIMAGKLLDIKTAAVTYGIREGKHLGPLEADYYFDTAFQLAEFLQNTIYQAV